MPFKIKYGLLLCGLMNLPLIVICAQEWTIFNSSYTYNYRSPNSEYINSTIFADSSKYDSGDSIFYLNRIIKDYNDSTNTNGIPDFAHYNASQFLMGQVRKTDSSFIFESPHKFEILNSFQIDREWNFDTENEIYASYLKDTIIDIFNELDSVRIIGLSTGDTIVYSKNFGICRFDPVYEGLAYILAGIEDEAGEQVMDYKDFYDYQPGDFFEYKGEYWGIESPTARTLTRITILEREDSPDDIKYSVLFQKNTSFYDPSEPYTERLETSRKQLLYSSSPDDPTNGYCGQLYFLNTYDFNIGKLVIDRRFNNMYTKTLGSFEEGGRYEIYAIADEEAYLLRRQLWGYIDETMTSYVKGLGQVLYENNGFEWKGSNVLVAYKKGEETFGTFYPDDTYLAVEGSLEKIASIYPNPATEYIYIKNLCLSGHLRANLIDLNGKVLKSLQNNNRIPVYDLDPGVYVLHLEIDGKHSYQKVLVQ